MFVIWWKEHRAQDQDTWFQVPVLLLYSRVTEDMLFGFSECQRPHLQNKKCGLFISKGLICPIVNDSLVVKPLDTTQYAAEICTKRKNKEKKKEGKTHTDQCSFP